MAHALIAGAIATVLVALSPMSPAAESPSLQIVIENTNLVLTFEGKLQQAAQANGPFTNVIGARSPHRAPWSEAQARFWRAHRQDLARFQQRVTAGDRHTLAIRGDGSLWAWGGNDFGQLGNGSNSDTNTPQRIGADARWKAVAAGFSHTLALHEDGTLWAWGDNGSGRLGNGTTSNTNSPQPIAGSNTWRSVVAGSAHSVAIRADGTLWAWGLNADGQVGNGTFVSASALQKIDTNTTWHAMAAGYRHTVAVRTDGTLWTWGNNQSGQLGDGTYTRTNRPHQIGTNALWIAVAAGGTGPGSHTLAIQGDGTLWAWGYNRYGQLGIGSYTNTTLPQQAGSNTAWRVLAAGAYHSLALQDDSTLWAWGSNQDGQLGNGLSGPFINSNIPEWIGTNAAWFAAAGGRFHTVALRDDGSLWTWGGGAWGQLGNGTNPSANTPQQVTGGTAWGIP